jgi:hypothetical protein
MSKFQNVSFNRKGQHASNHAFKSDNAEKEQKASGAKRESSRERDLKQASVATQKSKTAGMQKHDDECADIDKRSKQFENEFSKNKAKEFKNTQSRSKAEQNKFQRSDQAKKLRRNHVDNQRNRKDQEYCLIEEKKYIKKRFLKDDSSQAMEDMDKDFAADYETAKEEKCRSESLQRKEDERETSYNEKAAQSKSHAATKSSYHASERHASESDNSDVYIRHEQEEDSESESQKQQACCSKCGKQSCKGGKSCSGSKSFTKTSKVCKKCGHKKCRCGNDSASDQE